MEHHLASIGLSRPDLRNYVCIANDYTQTGVVKIWPYGYEVPISTPVSTGGFTCGVLGVVSTLIDGSHPIFYVSQAT